MMQLVRSQSTVRSACMVSYCWEFLDLAFPLLEEMLAFQRRHGEAALRTADGGSVFGNRVQQLAATLTEAELRTLNAKLAYETAVAAGETWQPPSSAIAG